MIKILIATHNAYKRDEIKALMKDVEEIKVLNYDDLKAEPPMVVEDGKSFRQNAVKKAVIVSKFFNGLVVSDDSGLEVKALGGRPGIRSARFARINATDKENNEKLLKLLEKTPEDERNARFVCSIALAIKGKLLEYFEGAVSGKLLFESKGSNGFGYDPLFVPDGHDKTFAEITATYKNRISHRAQALTQLKEAITKHLKDG